MTIAQETARNYPLLRQGSIGDEAKYLQYLLNYLYGIKLKVDGIFGVKTEAAVKQFQQDYGLVVDGIVGVQTWTRLVDVRESVSPSLPRLQRGSRGNDVKYLQEILNHFRFTLVVDGLFGVQTEAAVETFQFNNHVLNNVTVKGIVGPRTWDSLLRLLDQVLHN